MYKIDCSDVSERVTDYAFDTVQDEIDTSVVEKFNYDEQTVVLTDVSEGQADFIVSKLLSKAHQKVCDMEFELEHNPDIDFEYTESEVLQMKEEINFGCFTAKKE